MSEALTDPKGSFGGLALHPLFERAQELATAARPRRRRHFGPPVEALNPHYAYAGRNEQPILEELISLMPPSGGLLRYVADLDRVPASKSRLTDREVVLRSRWFE
jgi:hypothetical protein